VSSAICRKPQVIVTSFVLVVLDSGKSHAALLDRLHASPPRLRSRTSFSMSRSTSSISSATVSTLIRPLQTPWWSSIDASHSVGS